MQSFNIKHPTGEPQAVVRLSLEIRKNAEQN